MKLHWGHKIGIVYCSFAVFLGVMFYKSTQTNHELVTENYYEKELALQGKIDANRNFVNADFKISAVANGNEIQIVFQNVDAGFSPKGSVTLYKPDNGNFDEVHDLKLDGQQSMSLIPKGVFGRYKVQISFEENGTAYFTEKQVVL